MPRIVRATDGKVLARLDAQWAGVVTATFSADGRRLATAGGDGTVLLWDTGTWRAERLIEGAHGRELAFSPDGRKLVSASWDGAVIANTDNGIVEEQLGFDGLLASVDWSPQGIVMVDNAGSLYLWPELPPL
jgi:WD40 repeat protein